VGIACWNLDELPLEVLCTAKTGVIIGLFLLFWSVETWLPFFQPGPGRLRHAGRNLFMSLLNSAIMALAFGAANVLIAEWTRVSEFGLLNVFELNWPVQLLVAVLALDVWMYVWHRLNHVLPILWRFHRVHHSDPAMDVTTAGRFHFGEHAIAATLRLALLPLLGLSLWQIIVYEALVMAVIFFHHANITLGRWDRFIRLVLVTPDVHKIHHSRLTLETDSNFSTVFSFWDRLAGTFRMRDDLHEVEFGLEGYDGFEWQSLAGMLRTPFASIDRSSDEFVEHKSGGSREVEELIASR
jgi:sterol desaturase/sphingolipid hydroxylase (fatty acid hydroxylase superfamily)